MMFVKFLKLTREVDNETILDQVKLVMYLIFGSTRDIDRHQIVQDEKLNLQYNF